MTSWASSRNSGPSSCLANGSCIRLSAFSSRCSARLRPPAPPSPPPHEDSQTKTIERAMLTLVQRNSKDNEVNRDVVHDFVVAPSTLSYTSELSLVKTCAPEELSTPNVFGNNLALTWHQLGIGLASAKHRLGIGLGYSCPRSAVAQQDISRTCPANRSRRYNSQLNTMDTYKILLLTSIGYYIANTMVKGRNTCQWLTLGSTERCNKSCMGELFHS